jgi:alginate O-acetyltransferase complex protein AlgI
MSFSSPLFIFLFLPLFFLSYLALFLAAQTRNKPGSLAFSNLLLLLGSLFFYFWGETWFLLVMAGSILLDFLCGRLIHFARGRPFTQNTSRRLAKGAVALSVLGNLAILCLFKYFNFAVDSFQALTTTLGRPVSLEAVQLVLPMGISFYTFQSMSYTLDVYRGNVQPTRNLLNFSCFVSMFPQLVAGPIIRYRDIENQLVSRNLTLSKFSTGTQRFIIGLGKKVLVADTVAVIADKIFVIPSGELTLGLAWLGACLYAIQIYFDFSGYSDMAIGLGKLLGFDFLENFNYPYVAQSIREFWRRWHISLSNWFKDYLYIPLGGNKLGQGRTALNLIVVFLLVGLWHGAAWNFVVWGLYHGIFLSLERGPAGKLLKNLWRPFRHLYTLLVVLVGWVLFRADNLPYALSFIKCMFGLGGKLGWGTFDLYYHLNREVVIASIIGVAGATPVVSMSKGIFERIMGPRSVSFAQRFSFGLSSAGLALFIGLFAISVMAVATKTYNPFIYFRF